MLISIKFNYEMEISKILEKKLVLKFNIIVEIKIHIFMLKFQKE